MTTNREASLLEALPKATRSEAALIQAELSHIRRSRTAAKADDQALDLAQATVMARQQPVFVHGMHTASSDWLDDVVPNYTEADLRSIGNLIRTEATMWFNKVNPVVRQDAFEFGEQLRGTSQRTASAYGTLAPKVASLYIDHVAHLYRLAEGTDIAGVPSAAGDSSNPDLDSWKTQDALPENTGTPLSAPPGLDAAPDQPDPTGDSDEPSDSAPTSAPHVDDDNLLDVSDSNNAASGTEASRRTAKHPADCQLCGAHMSPSDHAYKPKKTSFRHASVIQQRAQQFLAVEEGAMFPVPGEVDAEQSGEAESSLPYEVKVTDAPETMDNFVDPNYGDAASTSSERAKNISANSGLVAPREGDEEEMAEEDKRNAENKSLEESWDKSAQRRRALVEPRDGDEEEEAEEDERLKNESSRKLSFWDQGDQLFLVGRTAVATEPNPQGSLVYSAEAATDQGYKEGFKYALTYAPGKPVPAAVTSSAVVGDKYNAQYVVGYRAGLTDGIAKLPPAAQASWSQAVAKGTQVTSTRKTAHNHKSHGCPFCHEKHGKHDVDCPEMIIEGFNAMGSSPKYALPQLELADMDDTVSNPNTWSTDAPSVDGKGAADVANVPTPGKDVADYPQPSDTSVKPAIGEEPVDSWATAPETKHDETAAELKLKQEAFRRTVQATLRVMR